MNIRNTKEDYGSISIILHWLIAAIMIGLIPIGWYMTGLSDESVLYWRLLDLHEMMGLCLCVLVPLKFIWLRVSPNPGYSSGLACWERRAARAVHVFFLIAMVVIPLSGLLFILSDGEPVNLYNFIIIPDIGRFTKGTRDALSGIHYYLSYGCAALIVAHVFAALKHRFIDSNRPSRRMGF